jgi:signal transduction histidine kinase
VAAQPSVMTQTLPFWRQLRWTLVLYFALLTLAPLLIVQFITLNSVREQTVHQVEQQLGSVSELKQGQLEQWLERADVVLYAVARNLSPALLESALRSNNLDAPSHAILTDQLALVTESVKPVETNAQGETAAPDFDEVFIYQPSGEIIASTSGQQIGKIVTRQPYFTASVQSDFVSPPYYDVGTGQLTMVFSHPIQNADEQIIGVIAGRLNLTTLADTMLNRTGLGETGETYLVSVENHYLVSPSRFEGYALQRAYHSEGIDTALDGQNGSGVYANYQTPSTQVIGVYRWIPALQVALISEISEAEALSPYLEAQRSTILITLGAALVAVVVGFLRISQISRSLTQVAQVAREIADGHFERRVVTHQQNEVGLMASAFNQMTEQLVDKIDQLDQRVQEVNEVNQALRIATAEAKEASRLKDEFLAVMSHELRTPLNAIIGYSGIMQMNKTLPDRALHMVRRIRSNSERLLHLINDVLDISRIESGRMEIVSALVNVRTVVQNLESPMTVLSEQKALQLHVSVAEDIPELIRSDEDVLTKILTNLVANAVKFTETGQVDLKVTRQDTSLILEVSDTGIGIPPHLHEIIFERFRQADSSSKRAHGGSGLGLAIVHHLCTAMQGTIRVSSTVGAGSTFTVTLPLIEVQSEGVEKIAHVN